MNFCNPNSINPEERQKAEETGVFQKQFFPYLLTAKVKGLFPHGKRQSEAVNFVEKL